MKRNLYYFQPHMVQSLLLVPGDVHYTGNGRSNSQFSAVASGPTSNLTLTGNIKVATPT
jgi:hypothetical protein